MRVKVVGIALRHSGKRFEIGEVLDLAEHPDLTEVVGARLRARTAEAVHGEGAMPADLAQALATLNDAALALSGAIAAALDVVEQGPAGYPQMFLDGLDQAGAAEPAAAVAVRLEAVRIRAAQEHQDAIEQVAPAMQAASDAAAADGPAAASTQDPSGVEQPVARLAHNQEVAGSNPAPTPTDAPPTSDDTGAQASKPAPRKSRAKGAKA